MTETEKATQAEEMDRVIARIQKLLARTTVERGASEAEAETAMRMAQELMAKYNLDMAVIEASSGAQDTTRIKEEVKGRAMYKWQRELAKYVSEANFCYHLIKGENKWTEPRWSDGSTAGKWERDDADPMYPTDNGVRWIEGRWVKTLRHVFVGRKANVITAQLMYQYLTQTIENLVPVADNKQRLSRSAMSWKEGCAARLCERLSAKRMDLIKQHDAEVKAAEARIKEEWERKAREQAEPKGLPANQESEIKAAVEGLRSQAYDESGPKPEVDPNPERPEADSEVWMPPVEAPPQPVGTAMVLASVYDEKEREANWELANGYPPGTLAKLRAEREAREKEWAETQAKTETERVEAPVKEETERQRLARERREREEHLKNRRRWAREDATAQRREEREYNKRDHAMYNAGAEAGKKIGLDLQIKAKADAKKLKGRE